MTAYLIKVGDTLERISTVNYGTPDFAAEILSANPQLAGGCTPGAEVDVPDLPQMPGPIPSQTVAGSENEMSISVGGVRFRFWTGMSLARSIDSFDRFSFTANFEPDNAIFRKVFAPFQFQPVTINIGGVPVMTGTLVDSSPDLLPESRTVTAAGYARAGAINDTTMPSTSFPIEYRGLTLRGIAAQVLAPFGLTATFLANPGSVIDKISISPTSKVLPFLIKLAQQRNLVIGNDALGMLVFQQTTKAPPIQTLIEGQSPLTSVIPNFNPQQFYSSVTALTPATFLTEGQQFTVINPHLVGVVRPLTFMADDTFGADGIAAARARMGRMFGEAISYTLQVAGWRTSTGQLWEPNKRIILQAPGAYIFNPTQFLIRRVTLMRDSQSDSAMLDIVLPGSFEGVIPEVLPWTAL